MIRLASSFSLVALVTCAVGSAAAEPHASSSSRAAANGSPVNASMPDPSAQVCAPACRVGFTCVQGACVSACNPGCADSEQCSSDGQCVPKVVTPKRTTYFAPPPVVEAPLATTTPDADVEPTPPGKPGVHTHDGFYMRLALGPSFLSATWKGGAQDATVSGVGAAFELALGGTVGHGFVIGGGIFNNYVGSPTIAYAGQSADAGTTTLTLFGPFVDWYPSPTEGFHLQASAGVAYAQYDPKNGGASVSGTGFGATAGVGYEIWVGEQWSIGGTVRLQYATPSIKVDGAADSTAIDSSSVVPALLIGATYH